MLQCTESLHERSKIQSNLDRARHHSRHPRISEKSLNFCPSSQGELFPPLYECDIIVMVVIRNMDEQHIVTMLLSFMFIF